MRRIIVSRVLTMSNPVYQSFRRHASTGIASKSLEPPVEMLAECDIRDALGLQHVRMEMDLPLIIFA